MLPNILLNGKKIDITVSDLPIFIHGKAHSGASYFSLILIAHLVEKGERVLFFSAFSRGSQAFLELIPQHKDRHVIQRKEDIEKGKDTQIILVKSGDELLLQETVMKLITQNRILFIKNIEQYSEHMSTILTPTNNMIISGDIERCRFKQALVEAHFETKILFSDIPSLFVSLPQLKKYEGMFLHQRTSGISTIQQNIKEF